MCFGSRFVEVVLPGQCLFCQRLILKFWSKTIFRSCDYELTRLLDCWQTEGAFACGAVGCDMEGVWGAWGWIECSCLRVRQLLQLPGQVVLLSQEFWTEWEAIHEGNITGSILSQRFVVQYQCWGDGFSCVD